MDLDCVADVVLVIEATAINGAYINELKTNYISPTLEQFTHDDREYNISDRYATQYSIVTYRNAANLVEPICATFGPFTSPVKVMEAIEKLNLVGGGMESAAHMAEGFATAHSCFDNLKDFRARNVNDLQNVQRHCILICNSPPYSMPVMECVQHLGKTVEQLTTLFHERKINLSIIAPRKMSVLIKLYMKADGDQPLTGKNYAKNIRHLVLLKGYHLKERAPSPLTASTAHQPQNQQLNKGMTATIGPNQQQAQGNVIPIDGNQPQVTPQVQQHIAPMTSAIPSAQAIMSSQHQYIQQQFANQQQQQQPQSTTNPNSLQNPNFQNPNIVGSNIQQRWMFPSNQQQNPRSSFMQGAVGSTGINNIVGNIGMGNQATNSALISQLSAPSSQGMNSLMQQQMRQQMFMNQQQQQMQQPQQQQQGSSVSTSHGEVSGVRDREKIWSGTLEWIEKTKPDQQKIQRSLQCTVSTNIKDGEPEIKADNWPPKLLMQLMPKHLVGNIGGQFLKDSKMVVFRPTPCEALDSLSKVMTTGFAGCVHFTTAPNMPLCDLKVLILLYTSEKNAYLGFIPNSQTIFVERLRKVIQQKQMGQQQQGQMGVMGGIQQQQHQMQQQMGVTPSTIGQQQQDQQQHYNQYGQQLNMQMQVGPMTDQMTSGGPGPMQHQHQIAMLQQQQRLPIGGPQQQQIQQMNPHGSIQQRMIRPMSNNPGLRHLLQQQTTNPGNQFRPQMVGVPPPNQIGGNNMNSTRFEDNNFEYM